MMSGLSNAAICMLCVVLCHGCHSTKRCLDNESHDWNGCRLIARLLFRGRKLKEYRWKTCIDKTLDECDNDTVKSVFNAMLEDAERLTGTELLSFEEIKVKVGADVACKVKEYVPYCNMLQDCVEENAFNDTSSNATMATEYSPKTSAATVFTSVLTVQTTTKNPVIIATHNQREEKLARRREKERAERDAQLKSSLNRLELSLTELFASLFKSYS